MASSQKFIARNRAPRVQIEYDVELYGAEKKVQLPCVMGVMSDLSGKSDLGVNQRLAKLYEASTIAAKYYAADAEAPPTNQLVNHPPAPVPSLAPAGRSCPSAEPR